MKKGDNKSHQSGWYLAKVDCLSAEVDKTWAEV